MIELIVYVVFLGLIALALIASHYDRNHPF